MKALTAISFCMLLALATPVGSYTKASSLSTHSPFDYYGVISWQDEMARLDNFAAALQLEPNWIGYILVYNGRSVCPGEAQARALRAKRYVVERRGIKWNRVIWREEGYHEHFMTVLQPVQRGVVLPRPLLGSTVSASEVQIIKNCRERINRIKRSKW